MNLEDAALIFHEPACSGLIVSTPDGQLNCNECGQNVGKVEPGVLSGIIEVLRTAPARSRGTRYMPSR